MVSGAYEQGGPAPPRKHPGGGGKQGAVLRLEVRPLHLAAEDAELVAEDQDLDLLRFLGAQRQLGELEKATQQPVAKRQNDEVRFWLWAPEATASHKFGCPTLIRNT